MDNTKIEWASAGLPRGASWNPIRARNKVTGKIGWHCTHVTAGCQNCYAEGMNKRLGTRLPYKPCHERDVDIFLDENILLQPLKWREPRGIFVGSMTDAFAQFVTNEMLDRMFAVAALCQQHRFLWLTKQPDRMRKYIGSLSETDGDGYEAEDIRIAMTTLAGTPSRRDMAPALKQIPLGKFCKSIAWPIPNCWMGTSCEDQATADERIPDLLATPATVRFVSYEPALAGVDFTRIAYNQGLGIEGMEERWTDALRGTTMINIPHRRGGWSGVAPSRIDLVISGGESGPHARPAHPDWFRRVRDDCAAADVAWFFKQWGEWAPGECADFPATRTERVATWVGDRWSFGTLTPRESEETHRDDEPDLFRIGKARAGRFLDGRTHDEMPVVRL